MKKLPVFLLQLLAVLLILLGLITLPLPIPGPGLLILIGLALLIAYSPWMQNYVMRKRDKHPRFNHIVHKSSRFLPKRIKTHIDRTCPSSAQTSKPRPETNE